MTEAPTPARRNRWTVPILAAAGVVAVVAVGAMLVHNRDQSAPVGDALPSASPGLASSSYLESHWRLTAVTDDRGTTAIPAAIDASLELATNGTLFASDGVNAINGTFKATTDGFDVYDWSTTLAGYGGNDPGVLAAENGMGLLLSGPTPSWGPTNASGAPLDPPNRSDPPPVHVTVLAATAGQLTLQGSGVRLTFVRTGPAEHVNATPIPDNSSAPGD